MARALPVAVRLDGRAVDSTGGARRSGDAARRGGQHTDHATGIAGIYALYINRFIDETFAATGFRCIYRL